MHSFFTKTTGPSNAAKAAKKAANLESVPWVEK